VLLALLEVLAQLLEARVAEVERVVDGLIVRGGDGGQRERDHGDEPGRPSTAVLCDAKHPPRI
jgi:hypothetical protein